MIGVLTIPAVDNSLTVQRIIEIANAASIQDVIDTTAHTITIYDLERKLEREKKIEKLTIDDPYETGLIEVLDLILKDNNDLSLALKLLRNNKETFSRYHEYMHKVGLKVK